MSAINLKKKKLGSSGAANSRVVRLMSNNNNEELLDLTKHPRRPSLQTNLFSAATISVSEQSDDVQIISAPINNERGNSFDGLMTARRVHRRRYTTTTTTTTTKRFSNPLQFGMELIYADDESIAAAPPKFKTSAASAATVQSNSCINLQKNVNMKTLIPIKTNKKAAAKALQEELTFHNTCSINNNNNNNDNKSINHNICINLQSIDNKKQPAHTCGGAGKISPTALNEKRKIKAKTVSFTDAATTPAAALATSTPVKSSPNGRRAKTIAKTAIFATTKANRKQMLNKNKNQSAVSSAVISTLNVGHNSKVATTTSTSSTTNTLLQEIFNFLRAEQLQSLCNKFNIKNPNEILDLSLRQLNSCNIQNATDLAAILNVGLKHANAAEGSKHMKIENYTNPRNTTAIDKIQEVIVIDDTNDNADANNDYDDDCDCDGEEQTLVIDESYISGSSEDMENSISLASPSATDVIETANLITESDFANKVDEYKNYYFENMRNSPLTQADRKVKLLNFINNVELLEKAYENLKKTNSENDDAADAGKTTTQHNNEDQSTPTKATGKANSSKEIMNNESLHTSFDMHLKMFHESPQRVTDDEVQQQPLQVPHAASNANANINCQQLATSIETINIGFVPTISTTIHTTTNVSTPAKDNNNCSAANVKSIAHHKPTSTTNVNEYISTNTVTTTDDNLPTQQQRPLPFTYSSVMPPHKIVYLQQKPSACETADSALDISILLEQIKRAKKNEKMKAAKRLSKQINVNLEHNLSAKPTSKSPTKPRTKTQKPTKKWRCENFVKKPKKLSAKKCAKNVVKNKEKTKKNIVLVTQKPVESTATAESSQTGAFMQAATIESLTEPILKSNNEREQIAANLCPLLTELNDTNQVNVTDNANLVAFSASSHNDNIADVVEVAPSLPNLSPPKSLVCLKAPSFNSNIASADSDADNANIKCQTRLNKIFIDSSFLKQSKKQHKRQSYRRSQSLIPLPAGKAFDAEDESTAEMSIKLNRSLIYPKKSFEETPELLSSPEKSTFETIKTLNDTSPKTIEKSSRNTDTQSPLNSPVSPKADSLSHPQLSDLPINSSLISSNAAENSFTSSPAVSSPLSLSPVNNPTQCPDNFSCHINSPSIMSSFTPPPDVDEEDSMHESTLNASESSLLNSSMMFDEYDSGDRCVLANPPTDGDANLFSNDENVASSQLVIATAVIATTTPTMLSSSPNTTNEKLPTTQTTSSISTIPLSTITQSTENFPSTTKATLTTTLPHLISTAASATILSPTATTQSTETFPSTTTTQSTETFPSTITTTSPLTIPTTTSATTRLSTTQSTETFPSTKTTITTTVPHTTPTSASVTTILSTTTQSTETNTTISTLSRSTTPAPITTTTVELTLADNLPIKSLNSFSVQENPKVDIAATTTTTTTSFPITSAAESILIDIKNINSRQDPPSMSVESKVDTTAGKSMLTDTKTYYSYSTQTPSMSVEENKVGTAADSTTLLPEDNCNKVSTTTGVKNPFIFTVKNDAYCGKEKNIAVKEEDSKEGPQREKKIKLKRFKQADTNAIIPVIKRRILSSSSSSTRSSTTEDWDAAATTKNNDNYAKTKDDNLSQQQINTTTQSQLPSSSSISPALLEKKNSPAQEQPKVQQPEQSSTTVAAENLCDLYQKISQQQNEQNKSVENVNNSRFTQASKITRTVVQHNDDSSENWDTDEDDVKSAKAATFSANNTTSYYENSQPNETVKEYSKFDEFTSGNKNAALPNVKGTISPIASPTRSLIASPTEVDNDGIASPTYLKIALNNYVPAAVEIDGHMTHPPMPYFLYEVYLPKQFEMNKPKALENLLNTNTTDPRLAKYKQADHIPSPYPPPFPRLPPPISQYPAHQYMMQSSYDPRRNRNQHATISTTTTTYQHMQHQHHHYLQYNQQQQQPQKQSSNMLLYSCLQRSPWYQGLISTMKIQINQSISELVRALNNFQRERSLDPYAVFDLFKIDCAGELIEIMRNLGVFIDVNGVLGEDRTYQNKTRPTPVNSMYSFMQMNLASSAAVVPTAIEPAVAATTPTFISQYIDAPMLPVQVPVAVAPQYPGAVNTRQRYGERYRQQQPMQSSPCRRPAAAVPAAHVEQEEEEECWDNDDEPSQVTATSSQPQQQQHDSGYQCNKEQKRFDRYSSERCNNASPKFNRNQHKMSRGRSTYGRKKRY